MDRRLEPLRLILDEHDIDPRCVYPTHVQRNEKLMAEAVELTKRGCNVDVDTIDEDLRGGSASTWTRGATRRA
jgi:predicted metal-dependent phosphotriesterase family hydrolase